MFAADGSYGYHVEAVQFDANVRVERMKDNATTSSKAGKFSVFLNVSKHLGETSHFWKSLYTLFILQTRVVKKKNPGGELSTTIYVAYVMNVLQKMSLVFHNFNHVLSSYRSTSAGKYFLTSVLFPSDVYSHIFLHIVWLVDISQATFPRAGWNKFIYKSVITLLTVLSIHFFVLQYKWLWLRLHNL